MPQYLTIPILTFEPIVALFCDLVQESKRRSVVVRPVIVRDAPPEVPLTIVSRPLRSIQDIVLVSVLLVQKCGHLVDRVPVQALKPTCWVAHRDNPIWNDVRKIQTEIFICEAASIATDQLAK